MATVQVRYIVRDVDAAIAFYCTHLGFREVMHPAPSFAMLSRGDLRLVLSAPNPAAGGGQSMPDGRVQEPGGWNRFAVEVDDLAATVDTLRETASPNEENWRFLSVQAIAQALRHVGGNKPRAARQLGISRTQLYSPLRKYGLQCA